MKNYTGQNICELADSRLVQARPVSVCVFFADCSGMLKTLEGTVSYKAGDALLTGSVGERWAVDRERFLRTYTPERPDKEAENGRYRKRPAQVWALQVHEPFCVHLTNNTVLQGQAGDWLVQYAENDYGIIRSDIFVSLYE